MQLPSVIGHLLAVGLSSGGASAAVTVSFSDAMRYSDAGNHWDEDRNVGEIKRYLELLGERHLSPSQTLKVEIMDVDLAGRVSYFARGGFSEFRVLNGRADWPSVRLRYTLESDGTISDSAEETVADMSYLARPAPRASTESLYYEKRMLDAWFRKRFVEGRKATR